MSTEAPDKHADLKRLHEVVTRITHEHGLPWRTEAWEDLPQAEKDAMAQALAEVFGRRPEVAAPEGWQQLTFPEGMREGLCHAELPWWASPNGHLYCGTCHPLPWLGLGFKHAVQATFEGLRSAPGAPQCEKHKRPMQHAGGSQVGDNFWWCSECEPNGVDQRIR